MKIYTMNNLINEKIPFTPNHHIYALQVDDTYIYIGTAHDPIDRVRHHLGFPNNFSFTGNGNIAEHFHRYKRLAVSEWKFIIYTVDEVKGLLCNMDNFMEKINSDESFRELFNCVNHYEIIESWFIEYAGTILNRRDNVIYRTWPKRYLKIYDPEGLRDFGAAEFSPI